MKREKKKKKNVAEMHCNDNNVFKHSLEKKNFHIARKNRDSIDDTNIFDDPMTLSHHPYAEQLFFSLCMMY